MHNYKVLKSKSYEKGINNYACPCPLPNSFQTKCKIYQANIARDITRYKEKCYLDSCKTTFNDRFGNNRKSSNHVKHKTDMEK